MSKQLLGDVHITLSYRPSSPALQNWSGPGWYLSISDSENTADWVMRPTKVPPSVATEVAALLDNLTDDIGSVLDVVQIVHEVAHARLEANVRRLENTQRELAAARAELAAYNEEMKT